MKKYRRTLATLALLMILNGCAANAQTIKTEPPTMAATESAVRPPAEESGPPPTEETNPVRESVEETEEASVTGPAEPKATEPKKPEHQPETTEPPATQPPKKDPPATDPPTTDPPTTDPPTTDPPATDPPTTDPPATDPPATDPPATDPPATDPPATDPPATEPEGTVPPTTAPAETAPAETEPEQTEPPATEAPEETKPTEPEVMEVTYEFKRQVAAYAAQYLNQYRGSPCTVLSGMSQVAQYRANQLTWNFSHSTSDKRAALAYYEYGRYIDATEFGDDASNSYWEADSAEAICGGFYGTDPEAMGKHIADLIRNSSGHWSYIGSSEYSYMGIGVEYREGSTYGWYACVMVGTVNYG